MINRWARAAFCLVFIVVLFSNFLPCLMADTGDPKDKAIEKALAQAKAKPDATTKATGADQYRQKLREEVTVYPEEEEFRHEWDSFVRFMPTGSLKDQPGKVSITHAASEYSYNFKALGLVSVQLGVGGNDIDINASDSVPVYLPNHLTSFNFGAEATLPFFGIRNTYLRFGADAGFYSTTWNFKPNSAHVSPRVFAIYRPDEKLTLVLGIAANPGWEEVIFPIAGIIYKPNDRLMFNIVPETPSISYKITKQLSVFIEASMSGGEYKVNKDVFSGAALQYNEWHTGAGFNFAVNKNIDLAVSGGRMFNRYLKYRDSLGKVDMKDAYYSEVRLEMRI